MLISVKNSLEARAAAGHPLVSIVDLKNPSAGSLGFAGATMANEVINTVRQADPDKQISLACGELDQWRLGGDDRKADFDVCELERIDWPAVTFVKVGLSGNFAAAQDIGRLKRFFSLVPDHVRRVLVIYVDLFSTGQAMEAIRESAALNASVVLLDTFDKSHGNTFTYYSPLDCQAIFQQAKSQKMTGVLAGSIDVECLGRAAETGADLIGVRGAVCQQDDSPVSEIRKNSLCQRRLDQFLDAARVILAEARPVS